MTTARQGGEKQIGTNANSPGRKKKVAESSRRGRRRQLPPVTDSDRTAINVSIKTVFSSTPRKQQKIPLKAKILEFIISFVFKP